MAKKATGVSFRELMIKIRKKEFAPIYLLMGEEDYYIDRLSEIIEINAVPEDEKDFNSAIFYGADTDIRQVISRAQQYPLMAERQLVFLKEAQTMFNAKREIEKLSSYVSHTNKHTVLVVTFKGDCLNVNSELVKAINASDGVVFRSERPRDYQLAGPVADYCREKNVQIDDKGISLLCEYIGSPLSKLFGEIDKLIVASGDSRRITPELIEAIIGISKEYNSFELIKSISMRDYPSSLKILSYFSKNPKVNPGVMIIATLFNYFSKLFIASITKDKSDLSLMQELDLKSSYGLTDYKNGLRNFSPASIDSIIHAIRETDAKSKGVGSSQNEFDLLTELLFKIFTIK